MSEANYLIDTSAFARSGKPVVAAALSPKVAASRVSLCAPVRFELCFSARTAADYEMLFARLDAFRDIPVTAADHDRALELQALLAERSNHRALSLVDALVCAVAGTHGLTVLHYDSDFELVAGLTGQSHEWVVPRGTAD